MGCTDLVTYSMDTGEPHPICPTARLLPVSNKDVVKADATHTT